MENKPCSRIPTPLVLHRLDTLSFESSPLKKVLVVANVSAGKSTLINAITGVRTCKTANLACTTNLKYIFNKNHEDGFTYFSSSEKKYQYTYYLDSLKTENASHIAFHFNSSLSDTNICLIDTPGVNDSHNSNNGRTTLEAIRQNQYDVLLFIANAKNFGTDDDKKLLHKIVKHCKKPVVFILNQLDCFKQSEDSIEKMITDFSNDMVKMGVNSPIIAPVSAKAALLMKRNPNELDDDDSSELDLLKKRFSRPYYNLQAYTTNNTHPSITSATGIDNLELLIKNLTP
ncbi:MAG: dynamin family protein [Bacteroidales bacterium]|nr:dynamin family protein [Bacteroidales bacterium]